MVVAHRRTEDSLLHTRGFQAERRARVGLRSRHPVPSGPIVRIAKIIPFFPGRVPRLRRGRATGTLVVDPRNVVTIPSVGGYLLVR
jgi:hypothetical protein